MEITYSLLNLKEFSCYDKMKHIHINLKPYNLKYKVLFFEMICQNWGTLKLKTLDWEKKSNTWV